MKPDKTAEVIEFVEKRREEIIEFLRKLISFPSVTGDEAEIQKFIAAKLENMGLTVDMWEPDQSELSKHPAYAQPKGPYTNRPNVVGIYKGTGNGKSLLFNGHVDVVPTGPLESWEHQPWSGDIEGNRLYGRGTSDMKSGLATMTMALDILLQMGIKPKGDIFLEYTMDEELTGNGTLACVAKGYKADAGICCETSSMHVQPGCIGRIWFEIMVHGKPAGIQRAWEGVNAIEKGYAIVQAVSDLGNIRVNELSHPLYPDVRGSLPCMITVFQAGSYQSAFPDTCLLKGSFATLPGEDTNDVKKRFVEHILTFCKTDPWLKDNPPEVNFVGYCGDPADIPPDHPIVKAVSRNFTIVTGSEPQITGRQGAADIRYLIKYSNTPTVIFGPGLTEQMHATNEWVDINNLVTATKIVALTIMEWCGYE
ncbi:ArgE/DapE family deacylase [Chloroflexota bacterium]